MKNLIKDNFDLLSVLSRKKNIKLNKQILRNIDDSLVKAICECVLNVERGIIPLPTGFDKLLKTHKKIIDKLTNQKLPLLKKKTLIKKVGHELLPLILPPIIKHLSFLVTE